MTNNEVKTISVDKGPNLAAINPNTNKIYVTIPSFNTLSVIDGITNTVIRNLTIGGSPTGIDVNPKTDLIYVANYDSSTVSVIGNGGA